MAASLRPASKSLLDILGVAATIDVVDIGANPIDGDPPYKPLLDAGRATLVGFEPNPQALAELNRRKGPHETYLPHAVYDGGRHLLNVCKAPGMSSLLAPNRDLLKFFHGFPEWSEVVDRTPMDTVRLDDVAAIQTLDFLKIDVQGAELTVFRNGVRRLADCVAIHAEVEFLPMYVGQPLFSEVEMFLREHGFMLHKFEPLVSRVVQPMIVNNDVYAGFSQLLWADAVFVRDITRLGEMTAAKLLKLAVILHDLYGSHDLALNVLMAHDAKASTDFAKTFMQALASGP